MDNTKLNALAGQRFGRLLVIESAGQRIYPSRTCRVWKCLCDCGSVKIIETATLKRGKSKSCGCYSRELTIAREKTHGMTNTPTFICWSGMLSRCENKNDTGYKNYGGRGITVCARWHYFEAFYHDMGEKPEGLQLDRIDNSTGYFKENCRWVDAKTNCRNRRSTKLITINGETHCMKEWAEKLGLNYNTVKWRVRNGYELSKT